MHQDPDALPLQALSIKQHLLQQSQAVLFSIKQKHEAKQSHKKLRRIIMLSKYVTIRAKTTHLPQNFEIEL